MIDIKAPRVNVMKDTPAKRIVCISLVIKSYKIIVKMYARHTLYSLPRPPIKLITPVRKSMGKLTEYDKTPSYIVEINSS